MCGIVNNPTKVNDFSWRDFPNLGPVTINLMTNWCAQVNIPFSATKLMLGMVNIVEGNQDGNFVFASLPFAIYADGKRYICQASSQLEEDIKHLAMAGSVLDYANEQFTRIYELKFVMTCCCGAGIQSVKNIEDAKIAAYAEDCARADNIRQLKAADTVIISNDEYLAKLDDNPFAPLMFEKEVAHA